MIELHGWLTVRSTCGDEEQLTSAQTADVMQRVRAVLAACGADIRSEYRNGALFLSALICANHRAPDTDAVLGAFRQIAAAASGSYGLIWLHDDEDAQLPNSFQVYVFRRGQCIMRGDTDLSPCIPVIEDPV